MKSFLSSIRITRLLVGAILAGAIPSGAAISDEKSRDDPSTTLWYAEPAASWQREALPIGNGRLGAMIFGRVGHERIALPAAQMTPRQTQPGWPKLRASLKSTDARKWFPIQCFGGPKPMSGRIREVSPTARALAIEAFDQCRKGHRLPSGPGIENGSRRAS